MRKVRIGLAGCGLFGESHLQAFRAIETCEVAALFDTDTRRAKEMAAAFGVPQVSRSLDELLAADIDALDVVTPEETHLDPVMRAIAAGKHVFVEKPLATTLDDCERMIRAARDTNRILMPGMLLRFETRYVMLKEEIASGRLGTLISMHARRNRSKMLLERYGRTHPVLEAAIHDIDLMLWYTGERVTRVRGYGRKATGGKHHDTFWGVLEFEGGCLGIIETIWLLPQASGVILDDAFQAVGSRGIANFALFPGSLSLWREEGFLVPDTGYDPRVRNAAHGGLRDELAYFCSCVAADRQPEVINNTDAKNGIRVALALIESANADRDVTISDWK